MPLAAAQLRSQIERALEHRIPSALTPQARLVRPLAPTGILALDALLDGGLPVGAITEIVGALASGRMSCAQAFLAQTIRRGQVCAWIDVADGFDPESAAANGVDLEKLLWVRCGTNTPQQLSSLTPTAAPPAPATLASSTVIAGGGGSPHPRNEGRGLSQAVEALFRGDTSARQAAQAQRPSRRDRSIGTPGAANRPLQPRREEQVASDRLPARRGAYVLSHRSELNAPVSGASRHDFQQARAGAEVYAQAGPRCAEPQTKPPQGSTPPVAKVLQVPAPFSWSSAGESQASLPGRQSNRREAKPWDRLDQALQITDLLLQAGGFGAVVLDLGMIPPQFASRIPLASWFRFRAAADRARTTVVLLTQHPCAQTSAELVLRTAVLLPAQGTVLEALHYSVELVRQRFQPAPGNVVSLRKPPARVSSTEWVAQGAWAGPRP